MLVEFPKGATPVSLPKWYERKRWMTVGGIFLLALAFWTARAGVKEKGHLRDFFQIHANLAKLRKGESVDQKEFADLLKIHPEIKPLAEPALIQDHQLSGKIEEVIRLGESGLKRLTYVDPLYLQFSKASLLIEKGEKKKALELSLDLQDKAKDYPVLYELNLQRIAFLRRA